MPEVLFNSYGEVALGEAEERIQNEIAIEEQRLRLSGIIITRSNENTEENNPFDTVLKGLDL